MFLLIGLAQRLTAGLRLRFAVAPLAVTCSSVTSVAYATVCALTASSQTRMPLYAMRSCWSFGQLGKRHRRNHPTPIGLGRGRNPHPSCPCYFGGMGEFIGSPTPWVFAIGSTPHPVRCRCRLICGSGHQADKSESCPFVLLVGDRTSYNSGFAASVRCRSLRCNLQFGHVSCLRNCLRPHCKFANPPPLYAMRVFASCSIGIEGQNQKPILIPFCWKVN